MKGRLRQVQRVQRPCGRSRHGIKDVLWTTGRLVCLKVHMEAEAGGSKPTACQGCLKEVCLACGAHKEQEEANQAWGCWGGWKACLGGSCRRGPHEAGLFSAYWYRVYLSCGVFTEGRQVALHCGWLAFLGSGLSTPVSQLLVGPALVFLF